MPKHGAPRPKVLRLGLDSLGMPTAECASEVMQGEEVVKRKREPAQTLLVSGGPASGALLAPSGPTLVIRVLIGRDRPTIRRGNAA